MKTPASRLLAVTRSVLKRMVRMSRPCAVSNPVRSTTARQPPSGVLRSGTLSQHARCLERLRFSLCVEQRPCHNERSVRRTKPHRMRASLSPVCCRILVPPNSTWFLSCRQPPPQDARSAVN